MKYRSFIFDVGNVLLRWSPAQIVRSALPEGSDYDRYQQAVFSELWVELDRGVIDEAQTIPELARRAGCSHDEIRHILDVTRESLTPLAQGIAFLDELAASERQLVCLTNMSRTTFARLREKYDFWHKFSAIFVSGDLRLVKPDPKIFRHVIDSLSLDVTATVFIDDHPANVAAARTLGMTAVEYDGSEACLAKLRELTMA